VDVIVSTEHKAEELGELAIKDSLTGVKNKTAYDRMIRDLEELRERDYGVVMIDLNYLKRINDNYGHDKGDMAITKLCRIICEIFAHSPVFRTGGDEFVVIVRGHDYDHIDELGKKFYETIEMNQTGNPEEKISAALGYALFEVGRDHTYKDVFKRADKAMYEAKVAMKENKR
jgi:diguanylate cyclase (GGDEF)-like protein